MTRTKRNPATTAPLSARGLSPIDDDADRSSAPGGTAPGRPRALLISGDLGAGHKTTAAAVAAVLAHQGWHARTVDAMGLLGHSGASAGQACFRRLLAVPGAYDAFHFSCLRPGTRLARLADYGARRQIVPRLAEDLGVDRPDVIIAVFATGASAAAQLARTGRGPAVMAFCPDITPHRLWVHEGIDTYLVTCEAAAQSVRRYQRDARIVVLPRPVRGQFLHVPSRTMARQRLDLPANEPCVLLMSGGWGIGPVAQSARELAAAGVVVLAVAGDNEALHRRLARLSNRNPRLRAFGFTDQIPLLMSACDLVITTSGVTCSEARAVGRQLLITDVIPGHGRENLQHELELGDAAVTSADAAAVTIAALSIISNARSPRPQNPMPQFLEAFTTVLNNTVSR